MSLYRKLLNHNENLRQGEWRGRIPQADLVYSKFCDFISQNQRDMDIAVVSESLQRVYLSLSETKLGIPLSQSQKSECIRVIRALYRLGQLDILLSEGLTNEVRDLCPEIWE